MAELVWESQGDLVHYMWMVPVVLYKLLERLTPRPATHTNFREVERRCHLI